MKKFRTFITLLLLIVLLTPCKTTYANAYNYHATNISLSKTNIHYAKSNITAAVVTIGLVRDGDTNTVQVFLNYFSNTLSNGVRFKYISCKSLSSLDSTSYGHFGNGRKYRTENFDTFTYTHCVYLGNISVPSDVKYVYVSTSDLQIYINGNWTSTKNYVSKTKIK